MSRVVFLDDSSKLDASFKESLNKTLMTEYNLFQRAAKPVVREETGNGDEIKSMSSSVRQFQARSNGKWHCCTFLLRNPKSSEILAYIGNALYFSYASLDSYTDAVNQYNGIYVDNNGYLVSDYSATGTFLISCYWRENDSDS